jgi:hypothetical protein
MPARHLGDRRREPGGIPSEIRYKPAQQQSQGDPGSLAARPTGVQPARVIPEALDEPALAAVVELAVSGVVREFLRRDPQRLQAGAKQPAKRFGTDDASSVEIQQMRQVGEPELAMQQRRIRDL